ncbi:MULTISPECIES: phosphate ABC transporter substrate-binding protein PstS [Oligella]|uniref:Phosphate-binding protein PstS n=2 Tax=Oligella urethralis TaxID=90245 RepID=A0A096AKK2_9BURK|nr:MULTISPECIES: phosphate ABC transporter substrate-binding protein PstS [Oligella]AVL70553.1 phosphate ABC transporter substrate-binding protein PstS [Oligella urethralis]KGF31197.1 phosphate ABC transporter substrate-binding protein [Oligella urethralis DNF00040]MDK6202830.1 phosphate ABC transporter substrate-binding protein PstS [Oligella urethralis]OFS82383.1 phosphate ABC transporter substrate-binding protein [Oligella sp. HMSC05A10]OFV46730.1 phosphate ABC transporter substrate-binding
MLKQAFSRVTLAVALGAAAFSVQAAAVTGAGASFPYPIYAKWAAEYNKATGNQVNYQSIGSGGGQQQIIAKTVDFGASDDPLSAEKLKDNNLLQFPAVIGGTVPVINVDGIKPGELKLTGEVLANIYLGKITKWDDAAIVALNDGLKLPNADIIVVHRSDGSGTTFGWTNYLSQVSSEWKEKVGEGKAVKWPVGQGGKGNEGVAGYVRQLANSIGYVEYAYAKQNNLSWTQLQNRDGKFVQPEQTAFAAAAANADWKSAPGMGVVLNQEPGAESWPITQATFILLHKTADKPEQTKAVMEFFDWAWANGGKLASELDYVPLPKEVSDEVRGLWASEVKAADGSAVWSK